MAEIDKFDNVTLESILKDVDFIYLQENYVPSNAAIKIINFIKLVNGEEGEENKTPVMHYAIVDTIIDNTFTLIIAFRGSAKTSLLEYIVLYIATFGELDGFGKVDLALYVSDTMENGVKNFRSNIEYRWESSDFLKKFVPTAKFTDSRLTFVNAENHKFILKLYGATTGVRGVKELGVRPKIAFLDDLLSDKNATSPTIMETISNIINNAVVPALHPTKQKMIWIGTPFNKKDPLYKAASSSAWATRAFPICKKFPCTPKEFEGAWEDRFPYEVVKRLYTFLKEGGRVDAFNQEYMLRILSNDDRLVLDEDIVWYKRNDVLNNLHLYNVYITTDFATSEREKADFSVISVWALDWTGRFHWIDGIVKRQDMALNVDDVFRFVKMYTPLSTGVEVSGQQKGFVSWLKREMVVRGIYFMIASDKTSGEEGLRPNTSKLTRFNVALPLFKQRKIAFPEELKDSAALIEFIDELTCVTAGGFKSLHDDCADTVSQLPLIEYFLPTDPKQLRQEERSSYSYSDNRYFSEPEEVEEESSYIV
jgi:predicted phage terminase large subunit-like protein